MACVNECTFIGFMAADPEIRMTPGGVKTANFRIGCTESWNDQSGARQERTEWVNCVAWRNQADHVQKFLRKGNRVYVRGKLKTRSWEDKNGGGKRYTSEIIVDKFMALSGHQGDNTDPYEPAGRGPSAPRSADPDDYQGGATGGSDDDLLPF